MLCVCFYDNQEVLELTQRKFLRHVTSNFLSSDLEPYPYLMVVDFMTEIEKRKQQKKMQLKQKVGHCVIVKLVWTNFF